MKLYTELQMKSMFVSGCEHYADCLKTADKLNLNVADKIISQMEFSTEKDSNYLEVYFDTVQFITDCLDNEMDYGTIRNVVCKRQIEQGSGGMYELAKEWTDEFTEKYKDVVWGEDDLEYYDTIEEFLTNKNKL